MKGWKNCRWNGWLSRHSDVFWRLRDGQQVALVSFERHASSPHQFPTSWDQRWMTQFRFAEITCDNWQELLPRMYQESAPSYKVIRRCTSVPSTTSSKPLPSLCSSVTCSRSHDEIPGSIASIETAKWRAYTVTSQGWNGPLMPGAGR